VWVKCGPSGSEPESLLKQQGWRWPRRAAGSITRGVYVALFVHRLAQLNRPIYISRCSCKSVRQPLGTQCKDCTFFLSCLQPVLVAAMASMEGLIPARPPTALVCCGSHALRLRQLHSNRPPSKLQAVPQSETIIIYCNYCLSLKHAAGLAVKVA
jgi:hypothetical protein